MSQSRITHEVDEEESESEVILINDKTKEANYASMYMKLRESVNLRK